MRLPPMLVVINREEVRGHHLVTKICGELVVNMCLKPHMSG